MNTCIFHKWYYPTETTRICLKCAAIQMEHSYEGDDYWGINEDYDMWTKRIEEDRLREAHQNNSHIRALKYLNGITDTKRSGLSS